MNPGRVNAVEQQDIVRVNAPLPVRPNIFLLIATYIALFVGSITSSLLAKYYFVHGGSSWWVSTWVQSVGFPLLLVIVYYPYFVLRTTTRRPFTDFTRRMFIISSLIGFVLGLNNFLISCGTSYLPVSTSSLLLSTQLIFTLLLSVVIVKQKVTFSNVNCVVLLTISAVLLALDPSKDEPAGSTKTKYFIGFVSTIGAGLLFALYLPVTEKLYQSANCLTMVMEIQLIMEVTATVFATIGMVFNGGFNEMVKEANHVFDKGPRVYWMVVIFANVATWQLCFASTSAMVYLTSGLNGGICMTAMLALNVVGGVVVYHDEFNGVKQVATFICIWAFSTYVYAKYEKMKKDEEEERRVYSGVNTLEEYDGVEMVTV